MQKVEAIEPFTEDDGKGGEIERLPGEPFSVTNDRAELLRERGLIGKASSRTEKGDDEKADAPKE